MVTLVFLGGIDIIFSSNVEVTVCLDGYSGMIFLQTLKILLTIFLALNTHHISFAMLIALVFDFGFRRLLAIGVYLQYYIHTLCSKLESYPYEVEIGSIASPSLTELLEQAILSFTVEHSSIFIISKLSFSNSWFVSGVIYRWCIVASLISFSMQFQFSVNCTKRRWFPLIALCFVRFYVFSNSLSASTGLFRRLVNVQSWFLPMRRGKSLFWTRKRPSHVILIQIAVCMAHSRWLEACNPSFLFYLWESYLNSTL